MIFLGASRLLATEPDEVLAVPDADVESAQRDTLLRSMIEAKLPQLKTIPDLIALMTEIDNLLPEFDGLQSFNHLYQMVTEEIQQQCVDQQWESPDWLTALDVEFGRLYFEGILGCLKNPPKAPKV